MFEDFALMDAGIESCENVLRENNLQIAQGPLLERKRGLLQLMNGSYPGNFST